MEAALKNVFTVHRDVVRDLKIQLYEVTKERDELKQRLDESHGHLQEAVSRMKTEMGFLHGAVDQFRLHETDGCQQSTRSSDRASRPTAPLNKPLETTPSLEELFNALLQSLLTTSQQLQETGSLDNDGSRPPPPVTGDQSLGLDNSQCSLGTTSQLFQRTQPKQQHSQSQANSNGRNSRNLESSNRMNSRKTENSTGMKPDEAEISAVEAENVCRKNMELSKSKVNYRSGTKQSKSESIESEAEKKKCGCQKSPDQGSKLQLARHAAKRRRYTEEEAAMRKQRRINSSKKSDDGVSRENAHHPAMEIPSNRDNLQHRAGNAGDVHSSSSTGMSVAAGDRRRHRLTNTRSKKTTDAGYENSQEGESRDHGEDDRFTKGDAKHTTNGEPENSSDDGDDDDGDADNIDVSVFEVPETLGMDLFHTTQDEEEETETHQTEEEGEPTTSSATQSRISYSGKSIKLDGRKQKTESRVESSERVTKQGGGGGSGKHNPSVASGYDAESVKQCGSTSSNVLLHHSLRVYREQKTGSSSDSSFHIHKTAKAKTLDSSDGGTTEKSDASRSRRIKAIDSDDGGTTEKSNASRCRRRKAIDSEGDDVMNVPTRENNLERNEESSGRKKAIDFHCNAGVNMKKRQKNTERNEESITSRRKKAIDSQDGKKNVDKSKQLHSRVGGMSLKKKREQNAEEETNGISKESCIDDERGRMEGDEGGRDSQATIWPTDSVLFGSAGPSLAQCLIPPEAASNNTSSLEIEAGEEFEDKQRAGRQSPVFLTYQNQPQASRSTHNNEEPFVNVSATHQNAARASLSTQHMKNKDMPRGIVSTHKKASRVGVSTHRNKLCSSTVSPALFHNDEDEEDDAEDVIDSDTDSGECMLSPQKKTILTRSTIHHNLSSVHHNSSAVHPKSRGQHHNSTRQAPVAVIKGVAPSRRSSNVSLQQPHRGRTAVKKPTQSPMSPNILQPNVLSQPLQQQQQQQQRKGMAAAEKEADDPTSPDALPGRSTCVHPSLPVSAEKGEGFSPIHTNVSLQSLQHRDLSTAVKEQTESPVSPNILQPLPLAVSRKKSKTHPSLPVSLEKHASPDASPNILLPQPQRKCTTAAMETTAESPVMSADILQSPTISARAAMRTLSDGTPKTPRTRLFRKKAASPASFFPIPSPSADDTVNPGLLGGEGDEVTSPPCSGQGGGQTAGSVSSPLNASLDPAVRLTQYLQGPTMPTQSLVMIDNADDEELKDDTHHTTKCQQHPTATAAAVEKNVDDDGDDDDENLPDELLDEDQEHTLKNCTEEGVIVEDIVDDEKSRDNRLAPKKDQERSSNNHAEEEDKDEQEGEEAAEEEEASVDLDVTLDPRFMRVHQWSAQPLEIYSLDSSIATGVGSGDADGGDGGGDGDGVDSDCQITAAPSKVQPSSGVPASLDDSFDRLPQKKKKPEAAYAYTEVVRKQTERKKLKAFSCRECEKYYGAMGLDAGEVSERMAACSRHRARQAPPSTPDHFWSIGFPDTPEEEQQQRRSRTSEKSRRM